MKAEIDRQKVLLILNWCIDKFGESRFCKKPIRIRVYKSRGNSRYEDREKGLRGTYDEGYINIYLGSIKNMKELCETIIHEYTHYKLSPFEFAVFCNRLEKEGYNKIEIYKRHPHEKKTKRMEDKWGKVCYNELKSKLYKK